MARLFTSLTDLENEINPILGSLTSPTILDDNRLKNFLIDNLIYNAIFHDDALIKQKTSELIYRLADLHGVKSSSIYPLYKAVGQKEISGFVVPAINIRTLTYDIARCILRIMIQQNIGVAIMEVARSEMEYTQQSPQEFALSVLAAAIKENFVGPIFLQGDHFQCNKDLFAKDKEKEINNLQQLITDAVKAGFYNIDIDASTLVDLNQPDVLEQQKLNSEITALLTEFIRKSQPSHVIVSVGGEIGHIGDRNSTVADFEAFMSLYQEKITSIGISKVSVQTGSSHGGTPLPDGTLQKVDLDFSVLKKIGEVAQEKYHLAGAVQHGASTLPLTDFYQLKNSNAIEVHLATALQNIVYDHLPEELKNKMYAWIIENLSQYRTPIQTDEQFIYKNRKKALGPFEKTLWELEDSEKDLIISHIESYLKPIFIDIGIRNTKSLTDPYFS
jgi:hypothetical protein